MTDSAGPQTTGADSDGSPFILAQDLSKTYQQGRLQVEALRGVNLAIPAGAFVVILGPSGGGKTTLLNLIGGISRPSGGSLVVGGLALDRVKRATTVRYRREQVGFVFQFFNLLPALSACDNVALTLLARGVGWREACQRSRHVLCELGMGDRLDHRPVELSGGEQQRVAIARAVVGKPRLLLADEPTGNLDAESATQTAELLQRLHHQGSLTCLLATHNEQFCRFATTVYEIRSGVVFLQGDSR